MPENSLVILDDASREPPSGEGFALQPDAKGNFYGIKSNEEYDSIMSILRKPKRLRSAAECHVIKDYRLGVLDFFDNKKVPVDAANKVVLGIATWQSTIESLFESLCKPNKKPPGKKEFRKVLTATFALSCEAFIYQSGWWRDFKRRWLYARSCDAKDTGDATLSVGGGQPDIVDVRNATILTDSTFTTYTIDNSVNTNNITNHNHIIVQADGAGASLQEKLVKGVTRARAVLSRLGTGATTAHASLNKDGVGQSLDSHAMMDELLHFIDIVDTLAQSHAT